MRAHTGNVTLPACAEAVKVLSCANYPAWVMFCTVRCHQALEIPLLQVS